MQVTFTFDDSALKPVRPILRLVSVIIRGSRQNFAAQELRLVVSCKENPP